MCSTIGKVLILDDDHAIGELIKLISEDGGYKAKIAGSVADFFKLVHSWEPDYLFIDLIMPNTDGEEVLRALTTLGTDAKITMISGAGLELVSMAINAIEKVDRHRISILEKPFSYSSVVNLLDDRSAEV